MTTALAGLVAFALALTTTPAGVSGAVFLLPIQVSLLGVPSPAVTPTNLLYNVLAAPGGLVRYVRARTLSVPLARVLVVGTLPGAVVGAVIRVELLAGERGFLLLVAAVLGPLGAWLTFGRGAARPEARPPRSAPALGLLGFVVGVLGGVYGIGGGSIIAPLLLTAGYAVADIAGAALFSTFLTSVAGIAAFEALALHHAGGAPIAPDWPVGISSGLGGLVGGYAGARLQPRVPERALRRLLGVLAMGIAARYLWLVLA